MANTFPQYPAVPHRQSQPGSFAISIGINAPAYVLSAPQVTTHCLFQTHALVERTDWRDEESRQAYMEACVEQDIAWQISINRQARRLTQSRLAKLLGTKQSAVTRWEDPCYGRHSIGVLKKIANAFDCALLVRLIPYSKLAEITKDTSDKAYLALSYESEIKELINYDNTTNRS